MCEELWPFPEVALLERIGALKPGESTIVYTCKCGWNERVYRMKPLTEHGKKAEAA